MGLPRRGRSIVAAFSLAAILAACESFKLAETAGGRDDDALQTDASFTDPDAPFLDPIYPGTDGGREDDASDATDARTDGPLPNNGLWQTPNGAIFSAEDAGVSIVGFTAALHPVVVPSPPLGVSSDDYTIEGVVVADGAGEFGILGRVQADGSGVILGSRYGGSAFPWIGTFSAPAFDPSRKTADTTTYTFVPGARYHFKLTFSGAQASGKIWDESVSEPGYQVTATLTGGFTAGRGVGYYTYHVVNGAVLKSITVSVP